METRSFNPSFLLLTFGLAAFGLAGLSITDMFLPRPYDGVVLDHGARSKLVVLQVVEGSGANRAGIVPGDQIIGIARSGVSDPASAARLLNDFRIGDQIPYLIKRASGVEETEVRLGRRRIGDGTYFYTSTLGFAFFFVGLFVLIRQPTLRVSQVFFLLCGLFLLFLVCRMRPPSYSGVDTWILGLGTVAFLFLPSAFLHFYLLFPRPAWLQAAQQKSGWRPLAMLWRSAWPLVYAFPPLVFVIATWLVRRQGRDQMIHGAPPASWGLLGVFMVLGVAALWANSRRSGAREQRGTVLVLFGSVFGLVPFFVASLLFQRAQHSLAYFLLGVMPLALVPMTFTYAIVRFQLLDIRVILRRSLLYTVTTALVTGIYAGGIASFNAFFSHSRLAGSGYFPIILALAIVLLFEPVRRRMQTLIDRFFFGDRFRLQRAMVELGEALTAQIDLQIVVEELMEKLPRLLGSSFAGLYLTRGFRFERIAGPETLPADLEVLPELQRHLNRRGSLTRLDQLGALPLRSSRVAEQVSRFESVGVEAIGELSSKRRHIGLVVLGAREGQMPLEKEELELVQGLLQQAVLALETSLLLEERTQQAEFARELEIAARIQAQLLPSQLKFADGWEIAAACRPAKVVGGDFYAQLPAAAGKEAVVFGDVSGKSVSGALMMMAAHEALHALALTQADPADLFRLTNRRLYSLGKRNFVALGYFGPSTTQDGGLQYLVAGQPAPILRRGDRVEELPLPTHRIPIGAMPGGAYQPLEVSLELGDLVIGYSDGVTDSRSPNGEFFGEQRLMEVVQRARETPREVVDDILDAVEAFTEGGAQYDDLTLVAVSRSEGGRS